MVYALVPSVVIRQQFFQSPFFLFKVVLEEGILYNYAQDEKWSFGCQKKFWLLQNLFDLLLKAHYMMCQKYSPPWDPPFWQTALPPPVSPHSGRAVLLTMQLDKLGKLVQLMHPLFVSKIVIQCLKSFQGLHFKTGTSKVCVALL